MQDRLIDHRYDALYQRITGADRSAATSLQLLKDSTDHEHASLALIAQAQHHILLDNYRISDDDWGRTLLDALCQRARAGVFVAVQCDWLGSWNQLSRRWVKQLREAGAHFNRFNTPGFGEPLAWLIRNHRKQLSIDGHSAIITGWCHSASWRGSQTHDPWRDTGVLVSGAAVGDVERAFFQVWPQTQPRLTHELPSPTAAFLEDHEAFVRVIAGSPQSSPLFRLDHTIIHLCQQRLWITDAYPVGSLAYLDSLRRAAQSGVDVRLLVPGSSDLPMLGLLARSSYRPLLAAGIRVFEWNGSMLHAKTAVADGCWARIGSSNMNPASWLGNYELDLVIESGDFAKQMEAQFLDDLDHATEICLDERRVRLTQPRQPKQRPLKRLQGSASTLRSSRSLALAVRESRRLDAADAGVLAGLGTLGLVMVAILLFVPALLIWPVAAVSSLISINLLRIAWRRWRLYRQNEHNSS